MHQPLRPARQVGEKHRGSLAPVLVSPELVERSPLEARTLEGCALPLFLLRGVPTPGDRCIARALKIFCNVIAGHHRRASVAQNLQVAASHGISDYTHGGGVAEDLKIATHGVSWAHRRPADVYRRIAVFIDQIANHIRPADLILTRIRGEALDLEIAYDPSEASDGECSAALNLHITADGGSGQNEVTAGLGDVPGHTTSHEHASLAGRDLQISHKSPAESAIAGSAGRRHTQFDKASKQMLSEGRRMYIAGQLVIGRRRQWDDQSRLARVVTGRGS